MERVDDIQVVPMLGRSSRFSRRPVSPIDPVLVKEAEPGPYMEGVSRTGGVFVSGRIFAVTIAKVKRMVGITLEQIQIGFLIKELLKAYQGGQQKLPISSQIEEPLPEQSQYLTREIFQRQKPQENCAKAEDSKEEKFWKETDVA